MMITTLASFTASHKESVLNTTTNSSSITKQCIKNRRRRDHEQGQEQGQQWSRKRKTGRTTTPASLSSGDPSLLLVTTIILCFLMVLAVQVQLVQAQPPTVATEQSLMNQPDCNAVGAEFVCDLNLLLTATATSDAFASNSTTPGATVVEATLECPLGEAGMDLNAIDSRSCGCLATLTPQADVEATTNTNANATNPPKQCTCQYCPLPPPGGAGTVAPSPNMLAIDCSMVTTSDPYVKGTCKSIACDGSCLDDDHDALGSNTTIPPNNINGTQLPIPSDTNFNATTTAPTNTTTTTPPPTAPAATETQEPTADPSTTSAPATDTDTGTAVTTSSADGALLPWWIPSVFHIQSTDNSITELTPAHVQSIQQAYLVMVRGVVQSLQPPKSNETTTTTASTARYLRQLQTEAKPPPKTTLASPQAVEIYRVESDSPCLAGDGPMCFLVYARYLLLLEQSQDIGKVDTPYTVATQDAITNNKMVVSATADNTLKVVEAAKSQPLTPFLAAGKCQLCTTAGQTPQDKRLPGSSTNTCEDVNDWYSQQTAKQCLNYGTSPVGGIQKQFAESSAAMIMQDYPTNYQDYCECTPSPSWESPEEQHQFMPTTTCPSFCPPNKQIPTENMEIVVDPTHQLTCQMLEAFADSILANPTVCLEVARHGAICCTEDIVEPPAATTPPPTQPTHPNGTIVLPINNSFLVYTYQPAGLRSSVLMLGPELPTLSRAYSAFVAEIVWEIAGATATLNAQGTTVEPTTTAAPATSTDPPATDGSSANETRYIRTRSLGEQQQQQQQQQQRGRRRLTVSLESGSAHVYTFLDTKCPSTVPFNSTCATAYGTYDLVLVDEDDPDLIGGLYTNYTQDAIDRGVLQRTLQRVEPLSWVYVEGATPELVTINPNETDPTLPPRFYAEEGGYDSYFTLGVGLSIAIIVVCIVGVICAADYSTLPGDDDSVDPWEREKESAKQKKRDAKKQKERAPSEQSLNNDPQTDKQEYLMYREQVEKLIMQKSPEEEDNIDELMDLFFRREPILIATLEHMPDASEREDSDDEEEDEERGGYDVANNVVGEGEEENNPSNDLHNSNTFSESGEDWDGGSSDEFAEETRDGSEAEAEADAKNDSDDDSVSVPGKGIIGGLEGDLYSSQELKLSNRTIEEGDYEDTDLESQAAESFAEQPSTTHSAGSDPLVMEDSDDDDGNDDDDDEGWKEGESPKQQASSARSAPPPAAAKVEEPEPEEEESAPDYDWLAASQQSEESRKAEEGWDNDDDEGGKQQQAEEGWDDEEAGTQEEEQAEEGWDEDDDDGEAQAGDDGWDDDDDDDAGGAQKAEEEWDDEAVDDNKAGKPP